MANTPNDDALAKQFGAVEMSEPQQPQPAVTGQTGEDDALAAKFGAVAPEQMTPPAATPSFSEQAGKVVSDTLQGIGEGALQTVHGVGEGIRQGLNVGSNLAGGAKIGMGDLGNKVIPPQGQATLNAITTPENTAQRVGSGTEALLEMMAGEGVLKGMSLAERLTLGSKIAKMAEDYPILGKILTHGLNATRFGAAQAGVETAKGVPAAQALEHGAETAGVGAGVGFAAEGAGALANHFHFNPETGLIARARQGAAVAQPPIRQALEDTAASVGSNIGAGVGARELLVPAIEKTADETEKIYDTVQRVAKFDLKTTQQQLINTENEIDELTATKTDKIKAAELEQSRTELLGKIDEAKAALQAAGLPVNLIDKADTLYKKESALRDLQKAVFGNEGVVDGDLKYGKQESIKVDTAIKNLQKLTAKTKYGPDGRLAQAIGVDGQKALMQKLYDARELGQKAIKTQELWKIIKRTTARAAITGVAGAAGGAAYGLYKAFE